MTVEAAAVYLQLVIVSCRIKLGLGRLNLGVRLLRGSGGGALGVGDLVRGLGGGYLSGLCGGAGVLILVTASSLHVYVQGERPDSILTCA